MRWKTTALLFAATLLVGAYISLHELRQPDPEQRRRLAQQILAIPSASVSDVLLEMPDRTVHLVRRDGTWRLLPNDVRANGEKIDQLLMVTSSLMAERVLSGSSAQPLDLKTYGLAPPTSTLTLTANGTPTTLHFGDTTPVHSNRYVRIEGRLEVAVVSSGLFDVINQPLERFRDDAVVRFSPWLIDELAVGSLTLVRTGSMWRLVEPIADHAQRSEVNGMLDRIATLRIERFVADAADDAQRAAYGLEPPRAEIRLVQREPSPTTTVLRFGQAVPDTGSSLLVYAMRSDEPGVYAVDAADVQALQREPQTLRAVSCFDFVGALATKITMEQANHTWTMERAGEQWISADGGTALETERVETFLMQLLDLRAGELVDAGSEDVARYGLSAPAGTLSVWLQDQPEPQRLVVGTAVAGVPDRYAQVPGRPGLMRLPAEPIAQLLAITPDQLRPMTPETASPSSTTP